MRIHEGGERTAKNTKDTDKGKKQKSKRTEEQKSKRTEEQKSKRTEEQKSKRTEEQKSKRTEEQGGERPRSHALRGNAVLDAPRPYFSRTDATQSVEDCIPTRSVGTRYGWFHTLFWAGEKNGADSQQT